jgi:hypothetical protein
VFGTMRRRLSHPERLTMAEPAAARGRCGIRNALEDDAALLQNSAFDSPAGDRDGWLRKCGNRDTYQYEQGD